MEVELPVGFIVSTRALPLPCPCRNRRKNKKHSLLGAQYLDDGKLRFYNNPLMTLLDEKMMRGAVVAFDDG